MSLLEDIPAEAVSPVLALIGAIVRIIQAGGDDKRREEALMQAAEDMKAELDKAKFGAG
jgi:hypothetical protein